MRGCTRHWAPDLRKRVSAAVNTDAILDALVIKGPRDSLVNDALRKALLNLSINPYGNEWRRILVDAKKMHTPACHICRQPIDLRLTGRDPKGWSLDHFDPCLPLAQQSPTFSECARPTWGVTAGAVMGRCGLVRDPGCGDIGKGAGSYDCSARPKTARESNPRPPHS